MIAGKGLSMGLDGAAACPAPKDPMKHFRARIVDDVDGRAASGRVVDLVLSSCYPRELGPLAHVPNERVRAARRA
eukprot:9482123-Alexandrium_andersonii.AAC.1